MTYEPTLWPKNPRPGDATAGALALIGISSQLVKATNFQRITSIVRMSNMVRKSKEFNGDIERDDPDEVCYVGLNKFHSWMDAIKKLKGDVFTSEFVEQFQRWVQDDFTPSFIDKQVFQEPQTGKKTEDSFVPAQTPRDKPQRTQETRSCAHRTLTSERLQEEQQPPAKKMRNSKVPSQEERVFIFKSTFAGITETIENAEAKLSKEELHESLKMMKGCMNMEHMMLMKAYADRLDADVKIKELEAARLK